MKYESKFDINQTVCFKDDDGGVKRGRIVGVQITSGWQGAGKNPDDYQLKGILTTADLFDYIIRLEQPATKTSNPPLFSVGQDRVALTFEDAWKLP